MRVPATTSRPKAEELGEKVKGSWATLPTSMATRRRCRPTKAADFVDDKTGGKSAGVSGQSQVRHGGRSFAKTQTPPST